MQVYPYLCFEGRCEEAIEFYQQALDAEVVMMMRANQAPPEACQPVEGACMGDGPIAGEKIMHAQLKIGSSEIMVSDGMNSGKAEFKGITLSVYVDNDALAKQRFEALSADGGAVMMPLSATFFASSFGVCSDKFGVSWMVLVPVPVPIAV